MGLEINYIEGQTPIDEDEKQGLKIPSITNREELDEFEQLNIERSLNISRYAVQHMIKKYQQEQQM